MKVPSSTKPTLMMNIEHIEDFGDPTGWQRIRGIEEHPEFAQVSRNIRAEAYERGRDEESKRSKAELDALREGTLDRLDSLLNSLTDERLRFQEENNEELFKLSLAIGEKIAKAILPGNSDALKGKLEACLGRLGACSSYDIHVNESEKDILAGLLETSGKTLNSEGAFRILPDPRLEAGDLVLEAEAGRVESICSDELDRLGEYLIQLSREGQGGDEHLPE
jgi:flagellar biosynthesis/type III secretory pathway protein FliH